MNRKDFPFLEKNIFLDSASGTLKPKQVVNAVSDFYLNHPINPHAINSKEGIWVNKKINETRKIVSNLIECNLEEVIFTYGTTDSMNKISYMLEFLLKEGDEILLSKTNHASSMIPFIEMAKRKKAKIVIEIDIIKNINKKTRFVIVAQQDNVINNKFLMKEIKKKTEENNAILINDAAQSIAHEKNRLCDSNILVFSSNKIYGPTGVGIMAIEKKLLDMIFPKNYGGGGVSRMKGADWFPKKTLGDFEVGTPNTAGIIGLGEAIKYFNKYFKELKDREKALAIYAYDKLKKIENVILYSDRGDVNVIFNLKNLNAQDVVSYLGHKNIILRAGTHCAHLVKEIIGVSSTIRISFGGYTIKEDIEKTISAIKEGGNFLDFI